MSFICMHIPGSLGSCANIYNTNTSGNISWCNKPSFDFQLTIKIYWAIIIHISPCAFGRKGLKHYANKGLCAGTVDEARGSDISRDMSSRC